MDQRTENRLGAAARIHRIYHATDQVKSTRVGKQATVIHGCAGQAAIA